MASYATIKYDLDQVATRIRANITRLTEAQNRAATAVGDLTEMSTDYSQLVTDIDAEATANPTDPLWETTKAEKDELVAEFNALKTRATQINDAIKNL